MMEQLESKRLIFVTGKGGVGKSTVTAAVASALARRGKRVLAVETDTYSALAELLDVRLEEGEPSMVEQGLWATNVRAEDALIHTIRQFVPSTRVSKAVIQNRVARVFFKAAPSVNEFSILNKVMALRDEGDSPATRWDHVVVDLPASGHAVTFLGVPRTLNGMMRVGGFAKMAGQIADEIEDPKRVAVVAAALPEEMPVKETIELGQQLEEKVRRGLTLVMLNMVHEAPFAPERAELFASLEAGARGGVGDEVERVVRGSALALEWYERDKRYIKVLKEAIGCPVVELPMFYEADGATVVERMAAFLNGEQGVGDELAS
jgi:anion-transporting  ArsA/GET3 family ATPase